jgi:hypothetical protein
MTPDEITAVNLERLGRWGARLCDQQATAVLLLGLRHDSDDESSLIMVVPENATADLALGVLRKAVSLLEQHDPRRN